MGELEGIFVKLCKNECPDETPLLWCVCARMSKVESSQQPAEEASPLGAKEAYEEVNHRGDKDDPCGDVIQVVESFLIGWYIQVPAGCETHTHTHTHTQRNRQTDKRFKHIHPHTCIQWMHSCTVHTLSDKAHYASYKLLYSSVTVCLMFWPDLLHIL